jgi:preprotein translocase subunit Sec61beta
MGVRGEEDADEDLDISAFRTIDLPAGTDRLDWDTVFKLEGLAAAGLLDDKDSFSIHGTLKLDPRVCLGASVVVFVVGMSVDLTVLGR